MENRTRTHQLKIYLNDKEWQFLNKSAATPGAGR